MTKTFLPDAIRITVRHEDFRVAFSPPFQCVALGALIVTELFFLWNGVQSWPMLLLVVPASVMTLCAVITVAMCQHFRFDVGPDGIDCFDSFGRSRRAHWSAITRTRTLRCCGLEYLLLSVAEQRGAIWIPLFVTRYDVLRDLLIVYSDEAHELEDKLQPA